MEVLQRSFHTVPRQVWLRAAHAILDRDTVHLDVDTLAELERACDAEAQEAARQVLVDLGDRIALSFRLPEHRTRFLEAIEGI